MLTQLFQNQKQPHLFLKMEEVSLAFAKQLDSWQLFIKMVFCYCFGDGIRSLSRIKCDSFGSGSFSCDCCGEGEAERLLPLEWRDEETSIRWRSCWWCKNMNKNNWALQVPGWSHWQRQKAKGSVRMHAGGIHAALPPKTGGGSSSWQEHILFPLSRSSLLGCFVCFLSIFNLFLQTSIFPGEVLKWLHW